MRSDQKLAIKCAWIDLKACNQKMRSSDPRSTGYVHEIEELIEATRETIEELETKFPWLMDQ